MPPASLIFCTVNCAVCQLALPPGAMAPVMSVAIPILIGPAACAHFGRSTQPPEKPATQPAALSALAPSRNERRETRRSRPS